MSLKDVDIKQEYRTFTDNLPNTFYIPLLSESISYKRAVGFFSSSALLEIADGLLELAKNNGHIQIIASPNLSDEDVKAIREGYNKRDIVLKKTVSFLKSPTSTFEKERLNLMANLIADGFMDIRIAVVDSESGLGIYHEKVGILEDAEGNKVAFSGSMNETSTALVSNYETIDVYCSWTNEKERVITKEKSFNSLWLDDEPRMKTYAFPELSDEIIKKYRVSNINEYKNYNYEHEAEKQVIKSSSFFKKPDDVNYYEYQKEAITKWFEYGCRGIFDMATGTGKTYTALGAITELSKQADERIAVIIVAPYQHLVEQWVEDINAFNVKPIIAYSYPGQNWRQEFGNAVKAYNVGAIDNFCLICTNATFSLPDFQETLNKIRKNYLFVVDEAHNIGAEKIRKKLPENAKYRLALSATIERHWDEEGTNAIRNYFGKTCIVYSLKDAIKNGFLTKYNYHPIIVSLSKDERDRYNELTDKILLHGGSLDDNLDPDPILELLLIQRARVISGCMEKVDKLLEIMKSFKNDNFMLIYCGATRYDNPSINDDGDVRQIEEINYRLYHELGMKVCKFTASENKEERKEIKKMFSTGVDLQAITAIKCLDEGMNIPSIKTAFILASSTNPKEYIQRRGRVLRKAPGKEYAEIYDFITLPRPLEKVKFCTPEEIRYDLSLVKKEIKRIKEFTDTASNAAEIDTVKDEILNTYYDGFTIGGIADE